MDRVVERQMNLLDKLGVRTSQRLFNAVSRQGFFEVHHAITLFRYLRRYETIADPETVFLKILNENYAEGGAMTALKTEPIPSIRKAIFDYWFQLASEYGYYDNHSDEDGVRYVHQNNLKEKFSAAWNRGLTLSYLQNLLENHE